MFYRRKYYLLKSDFVDILNRHFIETNLPNQLKNGSRLVGGWMKDNHDGTSEVFAIWEYDSRDDYERIESAVRSDESHTKHIRNWYEDHDGRERVHKEYFLEVGNEAIESTINL